MSLAIPEVVRDRVALALARLGPAVALPPDTSGLEGRVDPRRLPVPDVARFVLTDVLGFKDHGHGDKTAWEIDFTFDGVPVTMALRKWGVRVTVWGHFDHTQVKTQVDRIVKDIRKAIRIIDRQVLLPAARAAIANGDVTVANKQHQLRAHYEYFRSAVEECLNGEGRWRRTGEAANRMFANETEAFINLTAAVHSYYSWLEHILVLIVPFTSFDLTKAPITEHVAASWRDKFRGVFDVASDNAANRTLHSLVELAERSRNTWTHGAFDKDGGLLYAHVPGLSAIPMRVSEYDRNVHFGWLPGIDHDFAAVFRTLDKVDLFLESSPMSKYGLRYARAGLQVRFNERARVGYRAAMGSDEEFEQLIEGDSWAEDRAYNMDW